MSKLRSTPPEEDYEAIEAAVLETPRGRWFLAEYLRRHQMEETRALLASMQKLERAMQGATARLPAVREAFAEAARTIAGIDGSPFVAALPEAVEAMAETAAAMAARMEEMAGEDKAALGVMSAEQHLMARKLEALARALRRLSEATGEETPHSEEEPRVDGESAAWFAAEDDLFATPQPQEAAMAMKEAMPQASSDAASAGHPEAAPKDGAQIEILPPQTTPENATEDTPAQSRPDRATGKDHDARDSREDKVPESKAPESRTPEGEATGHFTLTISPRPAAKASPAPRQEPAPQPDETTREDTCAAKGREKPRPRIIITRKKSSSEIAIPMAEAAQEASEDACEET